MVSPGICLSLSCVDLTIILLHQVVVTAMGGTPAWRSSIRDSLGSAKTMPKTAAGMDEILSTEMIDLLYDAKYHQPISPITGTYPEVGKC